MARAPTKYEWIAIITVVLIPLCFLSPVASAKDVIIENYGSRSLLVYMPSQLPPQGARAMVVVLHGGLGNAQRIESNKSESALNMDSIAEENGFIVAYLNGTPVTRFLGADKLGWNAGGGCCGQAASNNIDDVGYIVETVAYLSNKYGVDHKRVFGMGHSNGAMMTQRLMCETKLYEAAVVISGPLNIDVTNCPDAEGKRILAIHGEEDENVPIQGGRGSKGISNAIYNSEEKSRQIFIDSGASYSLEIIKNADHKLNDIENIIERSEGISIAEKAARFFGLLLAPKNEPN